MSDFLGTIDIKGKKPKYDVFPCKNHAQLGYSYVKLLFRKSCRPFSGLTIKLLARLYLGGFWFGRGTGSLFKGSAAYGLKDESNCFILQPPVTWV